MMDKVYNERRFLAALLTAACAALVILVVSPASAQLIPELTAEKSTQNAWQAPDLAALPSNWWSEFTTDEGQLESQRANQFITAIQQRTMGLSGAELSTAENGVSKLKSLLELLALAKNEPVEHHFNPPLVQEKYFLDDVLDLRDQWRDLEAVAAQVQLQTDQIETQTRLIQTRRDKLLRQYSSSSPESPARIITGINRISGRVEYELTLANTQNYRRSLKQIETQRQLVNEQLNFAQQHLISTDVSLSDIQDEVDVAREKAVEMSNKVPALQQQLLDALSSDTINPSLQVLRKQQLTRASAEAELAELQTFLVTTKSNWFHLRAGELDSDFDLATAMPLARRVTTDALNQAELWASISQTTLTASPPGSNLNATKNFEIAQSVARDTLALVGHIRSTSDDLLLTQDILTKELISGRTGLGNTRARLGLVFGNAWDRLVELADFHLFNIGDTAVTPAGLFKMLLILGLAFGISWLIRFLLARGLRERRAAQSPAFYTLGRLLHYVIILAGTFAALSSIGIDFASFALIAGALSVGIGFGLQAIVSNFVSGLILLFEGTLRVGDYIELDSGLCGVVKEINTRATLVHTNDSVDVVVPNSELVTTKLTNWTLRETVARVRVPFGVAYGSDKELVRKLALEAVKDVDFALTNMPGREPQIRLTSFGDSALEFDALIWVSRQGVRRPMRIKGSFLWALETLLREHNIEIPFPQRDLHVRSDFRGSEEQVAPPETQDHVSDV
jgi:small-conductance mechanosensitive channel